MTAVIAVSISLLIKFKGTIIHDTFSESSDNIFRVSDEPSGSASVRNVRVLIYFVSLIEISKLSRLAVSSLTKS